MSFEHEYSPCTYCIEQELYKTQKLGKNGECPRNMDDWSSICQLAAEAQGIEVEEEE